MERIKSILEFIEIKSYDDLGRTMSDELRGLIKLSLPKMVNLEQVFEHLKLMREISKDNWNIKGWGRIMKNLERFTNEQNDLEVMNISFYTEKSFYNCYLDITRNKYIGILKFEDQKIVFQNELNKKNDIQDNWTRQLLFLDKEFLPNERFNYYQKTNNKEELDRYFLEKIDINLQSDEKLYDFKRRLK